MSKKYCKCKHKTINSDWIVCLRGNKADCDKCGKPVHHNEIIKLLNRAREEDKKLNTYNQ